MEFQSNLLFPVENPVFDSDCKPIKRQLRTTAVRSFFNQTERYLKNNGNIEIRLQVVREMVGDVHNVNILDLGCGNGSIALQFLNRSNHVTLVDISQEMLEVARQHTPAECRMNVEYINDDLALHVASVQYDLVLCLGVLAHVELVESTITKIAEVLRPGGRCVLQMTDVDRIGGKLTGLYCDLRNYLSRSYPMTLNRTGVRKVRSLASQVKMECLAERRYASLMPGMGRIPLNWQRRYHLLTLNTPWLSRHSSEAILMFVKTA